MSKRAEEAALKAYPKLKCKRSDWVEYQVKRGEDLNESNREIFRKGYEQAEKELKLTWLDFSDIHSIFEQLQHQYGYDYFREIMEQNNWTMDEEFYTMIKEMYYGDE